MISYMYSFFNIFLKNNKIEPIVIKNEISQISSLSSLSSLCSITEYIHILIVDDSISFYKLLKNKFETDFCYVDSVTNSDDAYVLLKNKVFDYDILLIDIFLPNVYGTVLIKQIREEIDDKIPIIALSSIPEFGNQALNAGANLFFEKGKSINKLKDNIATLIFNKLL